MRISFGHRPLPAEYPTCFHIQRWPKPATVEVTKGRVPILAPGESLQGLLKALLDGRKAGHLDPKLVTEYRNGYRRQLAEAGKAQLQPGQLMAYTSEGTQIAVPDNALLICTCSPSEARAGRCHRVWASHALFWAGWTVTLL